MRRLLRRTGGYGAAFVAANPVFVLSTLAVAIAGIIVTGNALEQPRRHPSPLFATRDVPSSLVHGGRVAGAAGPSRTGGTDTTIAGDSELARIQAVLADLDLYDGAVDGLSGPHTSAAIKRYQEILGLPQTGMVDDGLRRSLGNISGMKTAAAPPLPRPAPGYYGDAGSDDSIATGSIENEPLKAMQQALVRFGFHELTVDGVMGSQTAEAIATFQRIEGLPETGQPDNETVARMRRRGFLR